MSEKENDHKSGEHKEKNLKRHELCCLRFSDGTASDRDAATLKRKGIDPQPWVELQKLIRNHFVKVEGPDLADSICDQLGLTTISIGNAIGLSNEDLVGFSVMDVVSKRLELDFDTTSTTNDTDTSSAETEILEIPVTDENISTYHQEENKQEEIQQDPSSNVTDIVDNSVDLSTNDLESSIELDESSTDLQTSEKMPEKMDVSNADSPNEGSDLDNINIELSEPELATLSEENVLSSQQEVEESQNAYQNNAQSDVEKFNDVQQSRLVVEDISEEEREVLEVESSSSDTNKHILVNHQEKTTEIETEEVNLKTVSDNEDKEKLELDDVEITELAKLELDLSFGLYLIDDRSTPDLSSSIMSQVKEEHRSLVGSYDLEEDSLEQLIEDTYKSMTNPPPRTPVSQEPIKPLFDDILQDVNKGMGSETIDIESNVDNSSTDNIIDFTEYKGVLPTDNSTQITGKIVNDGETPSASQLLEEDVDEDFDSEDSEEFMLVLDSAIQIEAIEERVIKDLEAIFEGSRLDIATALRDPSPPSNSEMIRAIMEQVNRVGSIQHQLKLVTDDVDENDSENISLSYDDDFVGDVVVSITDIRPPVTVHIDSNSGNKTMLALSGLIAVAAALLLYFFASVPTGNETSVVDGFELAETDVEILDIDSDEDFSIMKRDGEPTIIFIHEE